MKHKVTDVQMYFETHLWMTCVISEVMQGLQDKRSINAALTMECISQASWSSSCCSSTRLAKKKQFVLQVTIRVKVLKCQPGLIAGVKHIKSVTDSLRCLDTQELSW